MSIPIIILLILTTMGLGMSLAEHGKPRSNGSGWAAFISYLLTWGLIIWHLRWYS